MKPSIKFLILAAALTCGFAKGQTTAYTTPVGYVTLGVPANSDTTVAPALERSPVYAGVSTGIADNVVDATGLTAGQYVSTPSYLQVTSGPLAGRRYPITANTSSQITVDPILSGTLQSQGFVTGNSFKVIPYWTLATLFPSGAGVGSTDDVFNVTSFLFVCGNEQYGANRAPSASYFYCSGDTGNGVVAGWYDANDPFGASKNDLVLDPSIMYFVRNGSDTPNSIVISGQVPTTNSVSLVPVDVNQNDVQLGVSFPVDMTLQQSGLQSVVQGTDDVFNISEFVFVYDDNVSVQNKAPTAAYFYCSGDTNNGVSAGWYDANNPFDPEVTAPVLKAGRSILIRKGSYVSSGVLTWSTPLPYTL